MEKYLEQPPSIGSSIGMTLYNWKASPKIGPSIETTFSSFMLHGNDGKSKMETSREKAKSD